jgi:hypothetical protein
MWGKCAVLKMDKKVHPRIVINYEEYKLLLKKAELYDQQVNEKKPQEGGSIAQIVATQSFNEGLLKPSTSSIVLFYLFLFAVVNVLEN